MDAKKAAVVLMVIAIVLSVLTLVVAIGFDFSSLVPSAGSGAASVDGSRVNVEILPPPEGSGG